MLHNPPHRRAFVAWVRNRHVVAVDYDAMEAEVGRLEAQLTEPHSPGFRGNVLSPA
jgi:hypothetical protein